MKDYKTILQEMLESLEKARITQDDFLLNNAEIEHLLSYIDSLKQENKQLKDNWNKLAKQQIDRFNESQDVQFLNVLQDMQELEQGSGGNE